MKKIFVTKADGEKEIFSINKLKKSMWSSGVTPPVIEKVVSKIKANATPGISTSQIHRLTFEILKTEDKSFAARYSLKKAIMRLGPDGFPFEKYFAALLNEHGYKTSTNVIVRGKCITHEIDVIAEKYRENIHAIIEAKFHSRAGGKTGSKDALYTYARFLDVSAGWGMKKKHGAKPATATLQSWLVTNTKVTTEAQIYARCVGIKIIGWDYASDGENLQHLIEHKGLYPITVLVGMSNNQRRRLLQRHVVLCKQLLDQPKVLRQSGFSQKQTSHLVKEVQSLLGYASF